MIREPTPAHSPESNGLVERANRTICEKARALLHDSKLPPSFWAEACSHACTLRNLLPTGEDNKSPWERAFGSPPDLSKLKVFGALCYIRVPDALRRKLDHKAQVGVLLGNDARGNYRALVDGKTDTFRDVVVDEAQRGWKHPSVAWSSEEAEDQMDWTLENSTHASDEGESENEEDDPQEEDEGFQSVDEDVTPSTLNPATPMPNAPHHGQPQSLSPPSPQAATNQAPPVDNVGTLTPAPRRSGRVTQVPQRYNPSTGMVSMGAHGSSLGPEPVTIEQALSGPEAERWQEGLDREYGALISNGTWSVEPIPEGVKPLPCKWVFKRKLAQDGTIAKWKCRLVAGGHRQGDMAPWEIYAPVTKLSALRMFLGMAAVHDWDVEALDISNAFLNGVLDEPVWMQQPKGFEQGNPATHACKLHKTLYGLKQSPRAWYDELSKALHKVGFTPCPDDGGTWKHSKHGTLAVIWVDDILVAGADPRVTKAAKAALLGVFKGTDLGEATEYLSARIDRDRRAKTLRLWQPRYIDEILSRYGMEEAAPKGTPLPTGCELHGAVEGEPMCDDTHPYAGALGALLYLSVVSRPDLAYAVSVLGRFTSKPAVRHWNLLRHVFAYVKGTKDFGLVFGGEGGQLLGYCDSDFASCKVTRRSRSGYMFLLHGAPILWQSKLQSVTALSTCEAEYVALSSACKEAAWLRRVAHFMEAHGQEPLTIHVDNTAAISVASTPMPTSRTKHIDLRMHHSKECLQRGIIALAHVDSKHNLADHLTKSLPRDQMMFLLRNSGVKE